MVVEAEVVEGTAVEVEVTAGAEEEEADSEPSKTC